MFGTRTKQQWRRIGMEEFERMRTSPQPPLLIDVRAPFELTAFGEIPGVVNIPLDELQRRRTELPSDHDQPIVVICQSGNRSQRGADVLAGLGYTDVASLDGGTMGWLATRR